jgi:L-serine dehydratase
MAYPSIFSVLKVGVGPSSSHTLGPLLAARDFRARLEREQPDGDRLRVRLLGSLARTGKGHLTDLAVTAGLAGQAVDGEERPDLRAVTQAVKGADKIRVGRREFAFAPEHDIAFDTASGCPRHPNTLRCALLDGEGRPVLEEEYLSVGGGVVSGGGFPPPPESLPDEAKPRLTSLIDRCLEDSEDLVDLVLENEEAAHGLDHDEVYCRLGRLWSLMEASIDAGLGASGLLPGRLRLQRRANDMYINLLKNLRQWRMLSQEVTLAAVYAIAVAEENASGERIVTAPTCGSSGVLPAALKVLQERFRLSEERVMEGLVVAGLVGTVVAANASVSGAECGCQAEVGTASAMAAAAACRIMGGTVMQVEFAAEMALEHHLGLTCDPVYGLVQIPCIERNAVGAVTALNAANLALLSDGTHRVAFDTAVATMKDVGADMSTKYKETALGGLATEVP